MDPSFGQHLIREHQSTLRRPEARERLSIEEQAAWGWLDEHAGPMHGGDIVLASGSGRRGCGLSPLCGGQRNDAGPCMLGATASGQTDDTRCGRRGGDSGAPGKGRSGRSWDQARCGGR
jgi:hypothetical protein